MGSRSSICGQNDSLTCTWPWPWWCHSQWSVAGSSPGSECRCRFFAFLTKMNCLEEHPCRKFDGLPASLPQIFYFLLCQLSFALWFSCLRNLDSNRSLYYCTNRRFESVSSLRWYPLRTCLTYKRSANANYSLDLYSCGNWAWWSRNNYASWSLNCTQLGYDSRKSPEVAEIQCTCRKSAAWIYRLGTLAGKPCYRAPSDQIYRFENSRTLHQKFGNLYAQLHLRFKESRPCVCSGILVPHPWYKGQNCTFGRSTAQTCLR